MVIVNMNCGDAPLTEGFKGRAELALECLRHCFGEELLIGDKWFVGYTWVIDIAHAQLLIPSELGEGLGILQMVAKYIQGDVT